MPGGEDLYYRSVDDLNRLVREAAARLPSDIDLIVGIPRSGLLVANLLALHMHLPMATLGGFANGEIMDTGKRFARRVSALRKVLVVDDSVSSGSQLRAARDALRGVSAPVLFAAAYCTPESLSLVDFAFEVVPQPRVFEWNVLNGEILRHACVDLDALDDPHAADGSVGERLSRHFHYPVGHIASTRSETCRAEIKAFLHRRGIAWGRLWLASDAMGAAGIGHLATTYRQSGAQLFITRDLDVARQLAEEAQRPVFSVATMQMIYPGRAPGAVMTFPGAAPPDLNVPLAWFVRQAATDVVHRLRARRPRMGRSRDRLDG